MKNKKGFTLIELLAILVILAIISLIAIPVVLNIIDKARVSSYARSADNILDAARIYHKETLIDSTMSIEGNNYDKVMEGVAGRKPDSGEIYIKKNGEIALALKYDKYCYKKTYSDNTITQTESEECNLSAELDENTPIITAKYNTITKMEGASKEITDYFEIDANGASGIKSTTCISDKDGNVSNVNMLALGTHTITCTVTKNNNKVSDASTEVIIVEEKTAEETVNELNLTTVTEGDGLYKDSDGVYRYKGSNPSNYIMLGEEEYRILAIEDQGIKVIRSDFLTPNLYKRVTYISECTDETCPRNNSNNTYCQNSVLSSSSGDYYDTCNVWSKASEIKQNGVVSDTITNGSVSGTVTENSIEYKVLHDTYYSNLNSVDKYILKDAVWNVGPITRTNPLSFSETIKNEESEWTWEGKVGLITISEYVQAQIPTSSGYEGCMNNISGTIVVNDGVSGTCGVDNWLKKGVYIWTMNTEKDSSSEKLYIWANGKISGFATPPTRIVSLMPVVYLTSSIQLHGSGTQGENAFRIVESN